MRLHFFVCDSTSVCLIARPDALAHGNFLNCTSISRGFHPHRFHFGSSKSPKENTMRPVNGPVLLATLAFVSLSTALTESYSGNYPDNCPGLCEKLGPDPSKWSQLHRLDELSSCNQSVIFDLNVHNSVDDFNTVLTIRACVSTGDDSYDAHSKVLASDESTSQDSSVQDSLVISQGCGAKTIASSLAPFVGGKITMSSGKTPSAADISGATQQRKGFMKKGSQCGRTLLFAKSGSAVVDIYSGADVAKSSAPGLLDAFSKGVEQGGSSLQIYSSKTAPSTFSVIAKHFEDLAAAQAAVKGWNDDGDCLDGATATSKMGVDMLVSVASGNTTVDSNTTISSNSTILRRTPDLLPRAECKTEQCRGVGDGCPAIAGRCGISSRNTTAALPTLATSSCPSRMCAAAQALSQIIYSSHSRMAHASLTRSTLATPATP